LQLRGGMNHSVLEPAGAIRLGAGSSADRTSLPVAAGDLVAGKYLVGDIIAYGGMGVVVSATHQELRTQVAMKIVRGDLASDEALVARLLNEARAAASLKSEHVARVIDCGKLDTGAPYLVMEHLEGMDLRSVLEERGPLPIQETVDFVLQVCEGVAEAHAAGIIHRDIKPENLFMTRSVCGRPVIKILDFGISKRITEKLGASKLTSPGMSIGSPWYMSPEQTRASSNVDERTDIWSLGVVLYELLTGKRPFEGETVAVVAAQVLTHEPPNPCALRPAIPASLGAVILRCLDKNADGRFQGIGALAAALRPHAGALAPRVPSNPDLEPISVRSEPPRVNPFAQTERGGTPSSECLQGVVATRCSERFTASKIPGVRSRRPLALSMAAALIVAGVCATASQRGYELADLPVNRATLSSTWDSLALGAVDLWNDLGSVTVGRPPPPPPKVPAARPEPVAELPPEALGAPVTRTEKDRKPGAARVEQVRAAVPLTSLRVPQAAGVHSGAMSYE
jgi:serine/threonine protein kinase